MNYKKIYANLIKKARSENRIKSKEVYYEKHHILPDFMFKNRSRKGPKGNLDGNPNDPENMVLLTAREHFISHVLLHKIYKGSRYEYQCGSSLYKFFTTKVSHRNEILNSKQYEKYKILGIKNISLDRMGKFPAVDKITGENVGSVSIDHPNVLSGSWVHHSKGKHTYYNALTGEKIYCSIDDEILKDGNWKGVGYDTSGKNNSNYKELTQERRDRIYSLVHKSIRNNYFYVKIFLELLKEEFVEFKRVSMAWINNNFENVENLVMEVNVKFNTSYQYKRFGKPSTSIKC